MRLPKGLSMGSIIHDFTTEKGNTYIYSACNNYVYPIDGPDLLIIAALRDPNRNNYESSLLKHFSKGQILNSKRKVSLWRKAESAFFPSEKVGIYDFMPETLYRRKHENLTQLILEVTQKCNFRCKYCIYRDDYARARSYGNSDMSWQVARRSIDYYIDRLNSPYRTSIISRKLKAPLSFYGGEPLTNLNLIKKCVEYIKKRHLEDRIYFNMTTNGSLIDKDTAKYLIGNDFSLLISLDGPQEEHDRNRIYCNGKGSFTNLINNIRTLYMLNNNYFRRKVSFSSVYAYDTNLITVISFFAKLSKELGGGVRTRFALDNSEIRKTRRNMDRIRRQLNELTSIYVDYMKYRWAHGRSKEFVAFTEQLIGNEYSIFGDRDYQVPENTKLRSGICTPGERRIYVDIDGNFHMCERISHDFPIGDCWAGVDYKLITEVFEKYKRHILDECTGCLAMNKCSICYATVGNNGGEFSRENRCTQAREALKNILRTYFSILEVNPNAFVNKPYREDL